MLAKKDAATELVRKKIRESAAGVETGRADAFLCTLSYQSASHNDRHAWIDTGIDDKISIDLEDWATGGDWDNAVARIVAADALATAKIVTLWLSGATADECRSP